MKKEELEKRVFWTFKNIFTLGIVLSVLAGVFVGLRNRADYLSSDVRAALGRDETTEEAARVRDVVAELLTLQSGDLVELTDGSVVMTSRWKGGPMGFCAGCCVESITFLNEKPNWLGSRLNGPHNVAKYAKLPVARTYNPDGSDNPKWAKLAKRYLGVPTPSPTP